MQAALEHHAHFVEIDHAIAVYIEHFEQEFNFLLLRSIDDHLESVYELVQSQRARLVLVQVLEEPMREERLFEVEILQEIVQSHMQLLIIHAVAFPHRLGELILEPG